MNMITQLLAKTRVSAAGFIVASSLVLAGLPAQAEVAIQEVKSEKGVTAWLVEDYSVPIVTIRFSFKGGSTQDPTGKEGLSELMSGLFDEGAGEFDSDTFQTKLDDAGAEMRFGAARDTIYGSMRMLAEKKDEAFDLLQAGSRAAALRRRSDRPHPRADGVGHRRQCARSRDGGAGQMGGGALRQPSLCAGPTRARRNRLPRSPRTICAPITRRVFARDNLHVAIVGAIDAETVKRELDRLFGDLPEKSGLQPVEKVDLKLGQEVRVDYDLPQTSLQLAYPGVSRDAPDFFAAYLMNHILGGGTFTSRLFDEVREKRGLAYGVDSSLVTHEYSSGLVISTATRSDRAAETLAVIRDTVRRWPRRGRPKPSWPPPRNTSSAPMR